MTSEAARFLASALLPQLSEGRHIKDPSFITSSPYHLITPSLHYLAPGTRSISYPSICLEIGSMIALPRRKQPVRSASRPSALSRLTFCIDI